MSGIKAKKKLSYPALLTTLAVLLLASVFISVFFGNGALSFKEAVNTAFGGGEALARTIFFGIRIPRVAAAVFSGAALAVSGYLLQNCLNNVLAAPGIIGINGGAGLFVLLSAILFPYVSVAKSLMAFAGACLAALFVYLLSLGTGMSKSSVILAGVAVSSLCSAFTDVVISLKPEAVADKAAFQLGGFSALSAGSLRVALPFIIAGLCLAFILAPGLDLLALGDETAGGLGLDVQLLRAGTVLGAALLAGAAVSISGLLGFVGLLVPNFVRLGYRGGSRGGLILCALCGGLLLCICDLVARQLFYPYELPCGLLLSCIGTPVFIRLLVKKRKKLNAL